MITRLRKYKVSRPWIRERFFLLLPSRYGARAGQDEKGAQTDPNDAGAKDDENAGETCGHGQSVARDRVDLPVTFHEHDRFVADNPNNDHLLCAKARKYSTPGL